MFAGLNVEDLGGSIASGRDIPPVLAEPNAANDTLVLKIVNKIHIKDTRNPRIENREPIGTFTLLVGRQTVRIQVGESITDIRDLGLLWGRSWACHLR